jgi:ATP-dependent Clp protease protease subunit
MNEMLGLEKELYDILAHHSGKTYEEVKRDSDRDKWMKSEEAKAYGLIDEILVR